MTSSGARYRAASRAKSSEHAVIPMIGPVQPGRAPSRYAAKGFKDKLVERPPAALSGGCRPRRGLFGGAASLKFLSRLEIETGVDGGVRAAAKLAVEGNPRRDANPERAYRNS
jgi:hypothetical protein